MQASAGFRVQLKASWGTGQIHRFGLKCMYQQLRGSAGNRNAASVLLIQCLSPLLHLATALLSATHMAHFAHLFFMALSLELARVPLPCRHEWRGSEQTQPHTGQLGKLSSAQQANNVTV